MNSQKISVNLRLNVLVFSCLAFNFRFVESILSATAMKARFFRNIVVNFKLFAFAKIEDETLRNSTKKKKLEIPSILRRNYIFIFCNQKKSVILSLYEIQISICETNNLLYIFKIWAKNGLFAIFCGVYISCLV